MWMKSLSVTIQMEACGTVYYAMQSNICNSWVCEGNPKVWPLTNESFQVFIFILKETLEKLSFDSFIRQTVVFNINSSKNYHPID